MHPPRGQIAKFSAKLAGSLALSSIRRFRDAYARSSSRGSANSSTLENVTARKCKLSDAFATHSLFRRSFYIIRDPSRFQASAGIPRGNLLASLRDTSANKIARHHSLIPVRTRAIAAIPSTRPAPVCLQIIDAYDSPFLS